jgi:hypothetical protein
MRLHYLNSKLDSDHGQAIGHSKLKNIAILSDKALLGKRVARFWHFSRRPNHLVMLDGAMSVSLSQHMSETIKRLSVDGLAIDIRAIADDLDRAAIGELEKIDADG